MRYKATRKKASPTCLLLKLTQLVAVLIVLDDFSRDVFRRIQGVLPISTRTYAAIAAIGHVRCLSGFIHDY